MPGLGAIPLAIPIIATAATIIGAGAWWAGKAAAEAADELLTSHYYPESAPPPMPPPAPPAPQTREELTSPELWAATMPGRIAEDWAAWQPFEDYTPVERTDDTLLYVALAAAAVAGVLMLRR